VCQAFYCPLSSFRSTSIRKYGHLKDLSVNADFQRTYRHPRGRSLSKSANRYRSIAADGRRSGPPYAEHVFLKDKVITYMNIMSLKICQEISWVIRRKTAQDETPEGQVPGGSPGWGGSKKSPPKQRRLGWGTLKSLERRKALRPGHPPVEDEILPKAAMTWSSRSRPDSRSATTCPMFTVPPNATRCETDWLRSSLVPVSRFPPEAILAVVGLKTHDS